VEDIEISPLWDNFKDLALRFDLRSCWSTPVFSTHGELLGTFAIYHGRPKAPTKVDLELIDFFVHFSSIALEKNNELKKLSNSLLACSKVMKNLKLLLK